MSLQTIKIGVTASALGNDLRQTPTTARKLGFAGVQFDAYSPSLNLTELSGSGRREFLRLLSSQDQQLVGLRHDLGSKGFGLGGDVDRQLHRLENVFESAASMVAPVVCVDLGPLPEPQRLNKPKPRVSPDQAGLLILPSSATQPEQPAVPSGPPPDPAFISQVDGGIAEMGRLADRYSIALAFRTDLASFAAIERVLAAASCPWFGLDLDPAAILRDEWDLDAVFSRFSSRIHHVRGRDAVAGADRRTRPAVVGAGNTDWGALLADLDSAGYQGWLTIDPIDLTDRLSAAEAGIKKFRALTT